MSNEDEDDAPLPYSVHETYLDGETGALISRHATLEEAINTAKARADKKRVIYHRRRRIWP